LGEHRDAAVPKQSPQLLAARGDVGREPTFEVEYDRVKIVGRRQFHRIRGSGFDPG